VEEQHAPELHTAARNMVTIVTYDYLGKDKVDINEN